MSGDKTAVWTAKETDTGEFRTGAYSDRGWRVVAVILSGFLDHAVHRHGEPENRLHLTIKNKIAKQVCRNTNEALVWLDAQRTILLAAGWEELPIDTKS